MLLSLYTCETNKIPWELRSHTLWYSPLIHSFFFFFLFSEPAIDECSPRKHETGHCDWATILVRGSRLSSVIIREDNEFFFTYEIPGAQSLPFISFQANYLAVYDYYDRDLISCVWFLSWIYLNFLNGYYVNLVSASRASSLLYVQLLWQPFRQGLIHKHSR